MHTKLLFIFLFLLLTNEGFSQTDSLKYSSTNDATKTTVTIFKKKELPPDQKVSPEIFYIVNDKPVSREEFLKQNKKKQ
jgi:RecA/RadA recombinase